MGAFVANFHVRGSESKAVKEALSQFKTGPFRVLDAHNNWVTVYEERASQQDDEWISELTDKLSARLGTACVAFMVHDSDIACYWLSDHGKRLDQYNSIPDYFDDDISAAEKRRLRGQPAVFLRYCQPGVTQEEVQESLQSDVTFAEDIISQLAGFLGIDPDRALQDYRDGDSKDGPRLMRGFDDDEGDDSEDDEGGVGGLVQKMQEKYAHLLAPHKVATTAESNALAQAAAAGNVAEVDRLVQAGADVNAPGMLSMESLSGPGAMPAMGQLPQVAASPLWAAASRGHADIVQRLIALGADAHQLHPLFGSSLHAATQKGSPETVKVLLDAGVPADLVNAQGMTARATLQPIRNQIEMTKKLFESMPQLKAQAGKIFEQMAGSKFPQEGWAACEELLRNAGG